MAAKTYSFEGGSNGGSITTSDTGSGDAFDSAAGPPTGGVQEYTNVSEAHGLLAGRIANRGTSGDNYLAWNAAAAAQTFYGRIYFMVDDIASSTRLCQFRESAAGASVGALWLNNTRAVSIRTSSDATVYTFTNLCSLSTWYRLEWKLTVNGASGPTIQAVLYQGDSTTAVEDSGAQTGTSSGTGTTWGSIRIGNIGSVTNIPSTTGYLYLDDLVAFDSAFPGAASGSQDQQSHPFINILLGQ